MQNLAEWGWIVFAAVFGILLAVDLAVHRGKRQESHRRALMWTLVWVVAGLAFWGFVWAAGGANLTE